MIAAFKVLGVVLAWLAVNDAIQFGFYMHAGIDPEYATPVVFTGLFAISIKAAGALLLIVLTEKVLTFLRISQTAYSSVNAMPLVAGAASLVGTYYLVQGLTTSVSTYVIARVQFSAMNEPGVNLLATNLFNWPWHDFVYGLIQALLGSALLVAIVICNKKLIRLER